jgi:hypothetical protein
MMGLLQNRRWRYACLGMAGVLVLSSVLYVVSNSKFALSTTSFTAVFSGILPFAPDQVKDLAELGLDSGLTRFTGMSAFEPAILESPELVPFFKKIGLFQIGMFYLRHPVRLQESLDRTAPYALAVRPTHLGNFEKSARLPPGAQSQAFRYWDLWKLMYGPGKIKTFEFLFVCCALGIVLLWLRAESLESRLLLEFQAMLLAMAAMQMVTVTITMANVDVIKQMFLFSLLCDTFFAISIVWLVSRAEILSDLAFQRFRSARRGDGAPRGSVVPGMKAENG